MNRRNLIIAMSVLAFAFSGMVYAGACWISNELNDTREDRARRLQDEAWKKERNKVLVLLWGEKIWAETTVEDYLAQCEPSRATEYGKYQWFLFGNPDSTSTLQILAKAGELVYASDSSCSHRTDFFDRMTADDWAEFRHLSQ